MLLKVLPPTVGVYMQHLKRAAYATMVDRSSHEQHPTVPNPEEFGWIKDDSVMIPRMTCDNLWPANLEKRVSCKCKKECKRNCSCRKKGVSCYLACRCKGGEDCTHTQAHNEMNAQG